jgi:flavin reductase (DIM6/NTAB) family NADH-FMN oxidoreductase RutF
MSGISFRELDPHDRYKLLCGVVVPRPIALVTTLDENGKVNAAPFSFFNVFSEDPPLVVLGLQHKADLSPKDTTRKIHRSGQFVVHMVDDALAAAMNDCAVDSPSDNKRSGGDGAKDIAIDRCRRTAVGGCAFRARVPATCRARFRAWPRTAGR